MQAVCIRSSAQFTTEVNVVLFVFMFKGNADHAPLPVTPSCRTTFFGGRRGVYHKALGPRIKAEELLKTIYPINNLTITLGS